MSLLTDIRCFELVLHSHSFSNARDTFLYVLLRYGTEKTHYFFTWNPSEDIPIPISYTIISIKAGQTGISIIIQITEPQKQSSFFGILALNYIMQTYNLKYLKYKIFIY